MKERIIEKCSLTEYVDAAGVCKMFAIRKGHGWMLVDSGSDDRILPFAAFFKSKKEIKDSFFYQLVSAI